VKPELWLLDAHVGRSQLLTELLEKAFTVRRCAALACVWKDLVGGHSGVLVADLTGQQQVRPADRASLCALSVVTPVLLLLDDPALAHVAHYDFARCNVLFEPFVDLGRVVMSAIQLSLEMPARGRRTDGTI
jgi:hypothetical protein